MTTAERVAKAIYEGRNGPGCVPWGRRPRAEREPYLKDAKAAIEALREPSPAVLDNALWRTARGRFAVEKADAWRGLIDAILNEETGT